MILYWLLTVTVLWVYEIDYGFSHWWFKYCGVFYSVVGHIMFIFILFDTVLFFRLSETLDRFSKKLESVYTASGGKKINLITHSMGGLLVKCFISLHSDVSACSCILDLSFWFAMFNVLHSFAGFKTIAPFLNSVVFLLLVFEKYVKYWIAIVVPF